MLDLQIRPYTDIEGIVRDFLLDGLSCVSGTLTAEQLAYGQQGAERVVSEQTGRIALEDGNRGFARYSFGSQIEHPEWRQLIDLPTVLPILEKIWSSSQFQCSGVGGDYSLPGAQIQKLHADMRDSLSDPLSDVTIFDLPSPFIVVNFLMTDFNQENGPTRFVRGTQRSRHPIPSLEEEPEWMQQSIVCAPAGTAIVRDVRCWHGGTENRSDAARIMISAGYTAPWFRLPSNAGSLPLDIYRTLSDRGRELCRAVVSPD